MVCLLFFGSPHRRYTLLGRLKHRHPLGIALLVSRNLFLLSQTARSAQALAFSSLTGSAGTADFAMGSQNTWCSTASVDPVSGAVDIKSIIGGDGDNGSMKTVGDRTFDLTTNSAWMEYIEKKEGRENVEGGAGAYDVMRCDLAYCPEDKHPRDEAYWRVWGEDFHLNRLQTSYCSLLQYIPNANTASPEDLSQALFKSRAIIRALLMEAHSSEMMQSLAPQDDNVKGDFLIQLVRVTVLWTPHLDDNGLQEITVRGHACSSCKPIQIHQRPSPIIATLAIPLKHNKVDQPDDVLPDRLRSPQDKVASWCRLRKPLEDPTTYKPPGVGEVLMVRPTPDGATELLEGLTSNVFVIYKDGTLRTPDSGVLFGYVRHLVLDCAERAGLRVDFSPILLDDVASWESAFITSSSRLIYPISRILMPKESDNGEVDFQEFWSDPYLVNDDKSSEPRWLTLLNEVLREGGYEIETRTL